MALCPFLSFVLCYSSTSGELYLLHMPLGQPSTPSRISPTCVRVFSIALVSTLVGADIPPFPPVAAARHDVSHLFFSSLFHTCGVDIEIPLDTELPVSPPPLLL